LINISLADYPRPLRECGIFFKTGENTMIKDKSSILVNVQNGSVLLTLEFCPGTSLSSGGTWNWIISAQHFINIKL
jgi:hypothetical protein